MAIEQMAMQKRALQTHQIWHVAKKYIGIGVLAKMFGVTNRTIYDYAADPAFVVKKGCREPFERMHIFLRMLDDLGLGQYAQAGLEYLATAVEDGSVRRRDEPRDNMIEEQLLDYGSVGEMHRAIAAGESLDRVEELKQASMEEISRTYIRYAQDHQGREV